MLRPSAFIVLLFSLAPLNARERPIDACGSLDQSGMTYVLQKDVSSPGTCFVVKADHITLDLNQHAITYGTASAWKPGEETTQHFHGVLGQACWDKGGNADPDRCGDGFPFLTIKNGSITQADHAPPYSHGIRLGQGNMRSITVENVRIRIDSPSSVGVLVLGGRGGTRIRNVTVENRSVYVFNRHQLEGVAVRLVDVPKDGEPDRVENLQVVGGPQGGVVETAAGSRITDSRIALQGAFTNDFGLYLLADRIEAVNNTIDGRSRGIQVDTRDAIVQNNIVKTFEEPVNEEYGGCQLEGTFGIQLEARSVRALVQKNAVAVRAAACDARAFRATDTKTGSANRSTQNSYRAVKDPDAPGKAVGASFSSAKDILLEGDTLYADTWNSEIGWDGAKNITLRGVTFIKGANAGPDYATFALLPGSNNAVYKPTSAELKVIDPIFRNGASAESYFMHPIGFGKWATPAEYSIQWTLQLTITSRDTSPIIGAEVNIVDHRGRNVLKTLTGADGRIPPLVLTQFRRFNTAQGVEKEDFSYQVTLSLGERRREFTLQMTAPAARSEVLP